MDQDQAKQTLEVFSPDDAPAIPSTIDAIEQAYKASSSSPDQSTSSPVDAIEAAYKASSTPASKPARDDSKTVDLGNGLKVNPDENRSATGAGIGQGIRDVLSSLDKPAQWIESKTGPITLGGLLPTAAEATAKNDAGAAAFEKNYGDNQLATLGRVGGQIVATAPVLGAGGKLAAAGAGALGDVPIIGPLAKWATGGIESNAVVGADGATIGGATTGNALLRASSAIPVGAAQGATFNALTNQSPTEGAEIGAVAGPLGHVVGSGIAALSAPKQTLEDYARNKLVAAAARDGVAEADIPNALQALGPDATMADLGTNSMRLMRASHTLPGQASDSIEDFLNDRQAGQVDRVTQAAMGGLDVKPGQTMDNTIEDLISERKANASPLYEKSNEGGSLAPLEKQFAGAMANATSAQTDAAKAVSQAEQALTTAKARQTQTGGNVYADNVANKAVADAQAKLDAAQNDYKQALQTSQDTTDRLRQAQADRENGMKGAVWSPRLQEFLDGPRLRPGLAKGMELERDDALAEGRPFNPTEYGIKGFDESGVPILSSVPNMRVLDAGKRGLDAMIAANTDMLGNKNETARSIGRVKEAYVKELDRLNPDYAPARAAYSGPSQSIDAVQTGKDFIKSGGAANAKDLAKLSDPDKQFFRIGAAQQINDMLQGTADGSDAVKRIFGSPAKRAALESIFPTPEAFQKFKSVVDNEATFHKNRRAILGQSATVNKAAELADVAGQNPIVGALDAARSYGITPGNAFEAARGNPAGLIIDMARQAGNRLMTPAFKPEQAAAIARLGLPTSGPVSLPARQSTNGGKNLLNGYANMLLQRSSLPAGLAIGNALAQPAQ